MPAFRDFLEAGFSFFYDTQEGPEAYFSELTTWAALYAEHPETPRHPLYKAATEKAEALATHLKSRAAISHKIRQQRPTENPESTAYRENAWEPITYTHTAKWLGYFSKIFHRNLFSISYKRPETALIEEGETLKDFLEGSRLVEYLRRQYLPAMAADPNGWQVVINRLPVQKRLPDQFPEPVAFYVPSSAVIYYQDNFLFVQSGEKSRVTVGNETEQSGAVFWAFDPVATYKISQRGEKESYSFLVETWDFHEAGEIPAKQMQGPPVINDSFFLQEAFLKEYDSIFSPALPYLNKMLNIASDIDVNLVLHAFLQKVEVESACDTCNGSGVIRIEGQNPPENPCFSCQGSGVQKTSLFNTYTVNPNTLRETGGKLPEVAKYIDIPTQIIDKLIQREEQYKREAYAGINLEFLLQPQTIQAQTAESKRLDRDTLNAFLGDVSALLFSGGQFIADWYNRLRYGPILGERLEENRALLVPPVHFDIESPEEIFANIEQLKKAEAPASIVGFYVIRAAEIAFGSESKEAAFVRASVEVDPLFGWDPGNVFAAQAQGQVNEEDAFLHFNLREILGELTAENPAFLFLPLEEQKQAAQNKALEKIE
jgi:hypothetical protein